jgi:hypothetical protein
MSDRNLIASHEFPCRRYRDVSCGCRDTANLKCNRPGSSILCPYVRQAQQTP